MISRTVKGRLGTMFDFIPLLMIKGKTFFGKRDIYLAIWFQV